MKRLFSILTAIIMTISATSSSCLAYSIESSVAANSIAVSTDLVNVIPDSFFSTHTTDRDSKHCCCCVCNRRPPSCIDLSPSYYPPISICGTGLIQTQYTDFLGISQDVMTKISSTGLTLSDLIVPSSDTIFSGWPVSSSDIFLPDASIPSTDIVLPEVPVLSDEAIADFAPDTDNADPTDTFTDTAVEMLRCVNEERANNGLSPIELDTRLTEMAEYKAEDMVTYGFSHEGSYGDHENLLSMFGMNCTAAGENIAYGQSTVQEVMNDWMNSDGHRANILDISFTKLGVGCYNDNGTLYWVQEFSN